ncbi:histidinol-phosphate transaminase [Candidatus Chloroploca sp. M-50]|uniref:Histidinol-phosphate aminotransferase n=1 Tax=Candidatus Chloroploca mongolica TaxID=2528176 RepID=A0ABS4DFB3_9CHLR|nr:histidinol-phosphate transaminase [Candidatus Chloroploca mongolica]MBP1468128.1 histidinol-phosphate transaminase [Candidatus Chloroploca mongolica]
MRLKPHIQSLPAYKPPQLLTGPAVDLIKLSSNENPLGPSPRALAALHEALDQVHRYPDSSSLALRQALGAHVGLGYEHVTCSNGSDELILILCLAILEAGDEVVMAEGTFISYLLRTLELNAHPRRVPLRAYTHDLEAMAEAITPQTRMIFLCNPNNPTGTSNNAAEVDRFLRRVPDDVLVVIDEAYLEFVTRPDYPDLIPLIRAGCPNLIVLRTFAKIYGLAGLRLGYAYAEPGLIAYLERARPTFNVNLLAQVAGVAALTDREHLARSREHAIASRAFFDQGLCTLGLEPILGETNFVAVAVGDDAAVTAGLREHGFTVTPLTGWGLPGLIRISFGTKAQNEAILQALRSVLGR